MSLLALIHEIHVISIAFPLDILVFLRKTSGSLVPLSEYIVQAPCRKVWEHAACRKVGGTLPAERWAARCLPKGGRHDTSPPPPIAVTGRVKGMYRSGRDRSGRDRSGLAMG